MVPKKATFVVFSGVKKPTSFLVYSALKKETRTDDEVWTVTLESLFVVERILGEVRIRFIPGGKVASIKHTGSLGMIDFHGRLSNGAVNIFFSLEVFIEPSTS